MKNGFRVYDVDTHINPGAEVLDKYVDPGFRPRLPELAPYKVEAHEHEPMFQMVTQALGDGVLMYASDYPHYESWFPDSVDKIMDWSSITPALRQKLFWDNANRCFKQT